jgi:hypothetical protein
VPAAATTTKASTTKASGTKGSTTTGSAPATDERGVAESHQGVPHALVTGRAVHPSEASTEVFARIVEDRGEEAATPARHASTGQTPVVRTSVSERRAAGPDATKGSQKDAAPTPTATTPDGQDTQDDDAWSPVPVPRPTYTMKATAPRREPAPLQDVEGSTAARATEALTEPVAEVAPAAEPPATTTGSIDLNAVLAKRRAAGE